MKTEIIFEDKDKLVVFKPAGIATQTSKVGERDVVSELKNYLKGGYVGVIHRLDQPVEGVLVFAKNQNMAATLSELVRNKGNGDEEAAFNKDYLAVVYGKPLREKDRLENMIVKRPDRTAEIVDTTADGGAKKAVLSYERLNTIMNGEHELSLLRIHLETGRFHQIRAQLSYAGLPIIGDRKYGSSESIGCSEELRVRNVALCADRLEFSYKSGKEVQRCSYSHMPNGPVFEKFGIQ